MKLSPPSSLLEALHTRNFTDAAPIWERMYPDARPAHPVPFPALGRHDAANISLFLPVTVAQIGATLEATA